MAIVIEFTDLVIPIATIERCEAVGGFQGFLREEAKWVGDMIWWDDKLCRADGAMSSAHVPKMIEHWEKRGLQVYAGEGQDRIWCDLCVVNAWAGPRPSCPWLAFERACAWHSGFPPGNSLVGPPEWFRRRPFVTGPALNLVVIRVSDLDRARRFYEALGLRFCSERHGNGPEHLAATSLSSVFEIYPRGSGSSTQGVRFGFEVGDVEGAFAAARALGAEVVSPPAMGRWGKRAVLVDPDGHRVEVNQRTEAPA